MSRLLSAAVTASFALCAPVVASAHHAFAAEFDREKPIEVTGTVTKVEWMNPHARIYVDAPDPDLEGQVVNWDFELGSPNMLMRQGWSRSSLVAGQVVTVNGWRARNAAHVANARSITNADGRRLFAGSSAETEGQQGQTPSQGETQAPTQDQAPAPSPSQ